MRQEERRARTRAALLRAAAAAFANRGYDGASIDATGTPDAALWRFLVFYVSCAVLTVFAYARPGGLLFDVERRRPVSATPALEGSR